MVKTSKLGAFIQKFYLWIILIFLYAPIVVMMVYSFNQSKTMGHWTGFTFAWYGKLFNDPNIMQALYVTLAVAVLAAIISTIIGTFAAIGIHSLRRGSRMVFTNVTYLPMVNPDIVTGVSLMILFIFCQLPLGFFTMLLAHITFDVPYVVFAVLPKLTQLNPHIYEAALDLGASPWQALRKVVLPEIRSGIVTGALMSFTLSLDDFVISRFTSVEAQNLSMLIYSKTRVGVDPTINALSTLMFVSVMALLVIVNWRTMRDARAQRT
nr:ABC transporter permease [Maliibacterium massiliense]